MKSLYTGAIIKKVAKTYSRFGLNDAQVRSIVLGVIGEEGCIADALRRGVRVVLPLGTLNVRERTNPATYCHPGTGEVRDHPRAGMMDRNVTFRDSKALRRMIDAGR